MKLSFDLLTRYALNFSMSPTRVTDMLSAARAVDAWNTSLRKFHRLPVSYKVRCVIIVALFLTYTTYTQVFIWAVILFYACLGKYDVSYRTLHHFYKLSPGVFIIIATPSRIAQLSYNWAASLAATPYGWLIFFAASGIYAWNIPQHVIYYSISVIVSFPPLIGHTTVVTLCGFAFGMKGFWIAATGALFGSAFVFVLLRAFFGQRLRQFSVNHKKWRGLEEVVVCFSIMLPAVTQERHIARKGLASHSTHTNFPISPMGIFKLTIRSQYMRGLPFLLRKDES